MNSAATEQESEPSSRLRLSRVLPFLAAGLLAVIGAWFAPPAWTEGLGVLEIRFRDAPPIRVPVQVGQQRPIHISRAIKPDLLLAVNIPMGLSTRDAVRIDATMAVDDQLASAAIHEWMFTLELADGRRERIPTIRTQGSAAIAVRRPPHRAPVVLGLLGIIVVLWITEVIPLYLTSLLVPAVLIVFRVARPLEALAPFWDPVIALFLGGFLMAKAMQRVRLDEVVAIRIVARAGRSPSVLFAALLGTSAFLSMWMSNTAATAVLIPIALAITEPNSLATGYRKACVLGIAFAATIGGVGSLIGTPANAIASEFLATLSGHRVTFIEWFAFGLPFVIVFLPLMGIYLWRRSHIHVDLAEFEASRRTAIASASIPLDRKQWTVLGVFCLVVAGWMTQGWHGARAGTVALCGAGLLALLGKLKLSDARTLSWGALITFGGALALGASLGTTGTSDWLATRLEGLAAMPTWIGVAAVTLCALAFTTVASNTASAALFVPLAIPLAGILGVNVTSLVVIVAIATSIDFALVMGTPPTMMAYSTGLFSSREIFRKGIALDLMAVAVLLLVVTAIWRVLGVV